MGTRRANGVELVKEGSTAAPSGQPLEGQRSRAKARQLIVVAGVIHRDGRVLIGQRRRSRRHALKWEFPGGKVEPGETPKQALARELAEELDLQAEIGGEIVRYEYRYPKRPPILLIFYSVPNFSGEPRNRVFEQIRWERLERLTEYDFVEGDRDFIRRLCQGEFSRILNWPMGSSGVRSPGRAHD